MDEKKQALMGMTPAELRQVVVQMGMPSFTGGQIASWLYQKPVGTIGEMTNISKANREKLSQLYEVGLMPPTDCQRSTDGTIKYLFPTSNGKTVETVYIPDGDRATLCVSSQVGCKMGCLFCQTGRQGFEGNLTAGDILNQIYALPERDSLTNVVFIPRQRAPRHRDSHCLIWHGMESETHHGEQCGSEKQIAPFPR